MRVELEVTRPCTPIGLLTDVALQIHTSIYPYQYANRHESFTPSANRQDNKDDVLVLIFYLVQNEDFKPNQCAYKIDVRNGMGW